MPNSRRHQALVTGIKLPPLPKCELGTMHDHARGPKQVDVVSELMDTGYIEVTRTFDAMLARLPNHSGMVTTYGRAGIDHHSWAGLTKRLKAAGYRVVRCVERGQAVAYAVYKEEQVA